MNRPRLGRWMAAALAAGLIGVLAGCGSTDLLGRGTTTDTARQGTVTGARATTATSPGTTTATRVSTIFTTTINGTTTTLTEPGAGHPVVLLGDMNTPEQFIVGALYQSALEAQGYAVELSRNIGATPVSEAALTQGSLDVFPEYLNLYDTQVAGDSRRFRTLAGALSAGRRWARVHGQVLLAPTPFSDTAGIAVLSRQARLHHLRTLADLRRIENTLTLGSPIEFSADPGGLTELERAYDFVPAVTSIVDIGGQYGSLRVGIPGAAYIQTTDWQLTSPIFRTLTDSRHVLGFGNIVPVVSRAVLAREGPDFAATLDRVDAVLNLNTIRGLASEMRTSTDPAQSAAEVAKEFLQGYGILAPPPWSTLTATTTATTLSPGP